MSGLEWILYILIFFDFLIFFKIKTKLTHLIYTFIFLFFKSQKWTNTF